MMTLSSFTTETPFSPETIYARWADPATWPTWDPEVAAVSFDSSAVVGAAGKLHPRKGPATRFTVTSLLENRTFTNTSTLPGARLSFEHSVEPHPHGSSVTVTVRLAGPLAPLWAKIIGTAMEQAAPLSVNGLLAHLSAVSTGHN